MHGVQSTTGEVAYLLASCQYVIDELTKITDAMDRIDHLDPLQDAMLEQAASEMSGAIKAQLDHAGRVTETWQATIDKWVNRK